MLSAYFHLAFHCDSLQTSAMKTVFPLNEVEQKIMKLSYKLK
jgi:hypothetical protein